MTAITVNRDLSFRSLKHLCTGTFKEVEYYYSIYDFAC